MKYRFRLVVIPLLIILVFILSFIGHHQLLGNQFNFWGVVYATLTSFLMEETVVSRVSENNILLLSKFLAALLLGIGVYTLLYNYIRKFITWYKIRFTYDKHIIIFSIEVVGYNFCADLLQKGYKVIVIESNTEHPHLEKIARMGAIVFKQDDIETKLFSLTAAERAKVCVVAYGEDGKNIDLCVRVINYLKLKRKTENVRILTHLNDKENVHVIRDYIDVNNVDDHYDLEVFNINHAAAKRVYDTYAPYQFYDLDEQSHKNSIAIVGYNHTAEEFLIENIILSHFDGHKLKVFIVDKEASEAYNSFKYKYPFYSQFLEVIPVHLLNNNFFANFAWSKEMIEKLSKVKAAYFFGDTDSALINKAANFRQFIFTQNPDYYTAAPIVICMPEDIGILDILDIKKGNTGHIHDLFDKKLNIHFIKQVSDTCTSGRLIEESEYIDKQAKVINFHFSLKHEFEHILMEKWQYHNVDCIGMLEEKLFELAGSKEKITINDIDELVIKSMNEITKIPIHELKPYFTVNKWWATLSHSKKESNRYAARHIPVKVAIMKSISCWPLNHDNITRSFSHIAPIEHTRWSAEKMIYNFRYGALPEDSKTKKLLKEKLKIHDQLVPYEKLDEVNKKKDLNSFYLIPLLTALYRS